MFGRAMDVWAVVVVIGVDMEFELELHDPGYFCFLLVVFLIHGHLQSLLGGPMGYFI